MTWTFPQRRSVIIAAWLLSVVVAIGLGWWAAAQATRPPQVSTPAAETVTVAVTEGALAVEQSYGIDVTWPTSPIGVNGLAGTLTSLGVAASGTLVKPGGTLYTVDLAPTVALKGSVPAFRDLAAGTTGDDVRQLQQFLSDAGYLAGPVDGRYGSATATAVTRWSADLGVTPTGTVPLGRIVFIPTLRANLVPAADLRVGARVTPGQELLVGADADPQFSFRILPEAVSRTSAGMTVRIDADGEQWLAEVDRLAVAADELGGTVAVLRPVDGSKSICDSECTRVLPLGGTAVLPGTLVLVPETSGAEVPTAAITTDASGSTSVTLEGGVRRTVDILASSDGLSIVDGVQPGDRVVVVGSPEQG